MPDPRPDMNKGSGRVGLGLPTLAAGLAFATVLAMDRLFHPLLLQRHPEQAIKECAVAAALAFGFFLVLQGVKKPWD